MKTSKEREAEFRKELAELLAKHNAEMEITDDEKEYGFQSGVCEITLNGVWKDGEEVEQFTQFRL